MHREHTKVVTIGDCKIGGGNPIVIQSMTNTKTEDVPATVAQILELERAGCQIIRCTVPTQEAALALKEIKKQIHIPLVADIHFDYRMAIAAIENGADKIRINPGNIGGRERIRAVVETARERSVPIRVGVNSGSLEKELLEKYQGVTAQGLVESALDKVRMIEEFDYFNLVISIKSSDVPMCVKAHELLAQQTDYPLHVGITEAGTLYSGNIKSAVGLGIILNQGIGDTIRACGRDPLGKSDSKDSRFAQKRGGSGFLSNLRAHRDRFDRAGQPSRAGGGIPCGGKNIFKPESGRYGLPGQWPRRSQRGRSGHSRGKGRRSFVLQRPNYQESTRRRIAALFGRRIAALGRIERKRWRKSFSMYFPICK